MPDFKSPIFAYRLPYGPHCGMDWETLDFMTDAGVNTVCFSPMNTTNAFGEPYSNYPLIWKFFDTYDFSVIDAHFNDILRHNPQAKLIPLVDLNSPHWFARRLAMDSFYEVSNCSLNPRWKEGVTNYMIAYLDYCESHYGDHIIGYVLACGQTQEWIEHDNAKAGNFKSAYYPQWCREHDLEVLQIPRADEISKSSSPYSWLFDPKSDLNKIQWLKYTNDLTADLAIHFISTARKHTRPEVRLGMFFGHIHSLTPSGQMECERVYQEACPDFLIGAACNSDPGMGSSSGFINVCETGSRLNIGYMHENDRLTTTSNRDVTPFIHLSDGIWVKPDATAEELAMVKREVGLCLVHHYSTWWFNIWSQSYKTAEIREALRRSRKIWDDYMPKSTGTAAEAVYLFDQESNYHVNGADQRVAYLGWCFRQKLYRCGVNFTTATWDDLFYGGADKYKFFVIQNPVALDERKLEFLQKNILKKGNAVLWCLPPAIIRNGEIDADFSERLTGNPVASEDVHITTLSNGAISASAYNTKLVTRELLHDLAERSGVHLYSDIDTAVWASREFIMAHRKTGGAVTIRLKEKAHFVRELYSDEVVAEETDVFTLHFDDTDTKVFYLS